MTNSEKLVKEGVGCVGGLSTSEDDLEYEDLHVLKDTQDMEFKAIDEKEEVFQLIDKKTEMLLQPREVCQQE